MPKLVSRAALAGMVFSQAKRFLDSPQGKQFIAQAKLKANDPATRAKVNQFVGRVRARGARA